MHIGDNLNTGLMRGNFTANRVEITGGRRSVYCEYNCTIENSWVHDQGGDPGGDAHFSGIRMGESTTVRHNTITCEALRGPGTGCSAGLTGYGDFGPVQNNLIENNIFSWRQLDRLRLRRLLRRRRQQAVRPPHQQRAVRRQRVRAGRHGQVRQPPCGDVLRSHPSRERLVGQHLGRRRHHSLTPTDQPTQRPGLLQSRAAAASPAID